MNWIDSIKDATSFDGSPDLLEGGTRELFKKTHATIHKVTKDIEDRFHFNTAISAIMELVNTMYGIDPVKNDTQDTGVMRFAMESVALLLSPIVPHFAEELWETLGFETSVLLASWPSYMEGALLKDELLIVIQVNGKLRSRLHVDVNADDNTIKELALSDDRVQKFINNKTIKKIIVVKNKVVNIVV